MSNTSSNKTIAIGLKSFAFKLQPFGVCHVLPWERKGCVQGSLTDNTIDSVCPTIFTFPFYVSLEIHCKPPRNLLIFSISPLNFLSWPFMLSTAWGQRLRLASKHPAKDAGWSQERTCHSSTASCLPLVASEAHASLHEETLRVKYSLKSLSEL